MFSLTDNIGAKLDCEAGIVAMAHYNHLYPDGTSNKSTRHHKKPIGMNVDVSKTLNLFFCSLEESENQIKCYFSLIIETMH